MNIEQQIQKYGITIDALEAKVANLLRDMPLNVLVGFMMVDVRRLQTEGQTGYAEVAEQILNRIEYITGRAA